MGFQAKAAHLRQINSVNWVTLAKGVLLLYPGYLRGRGISHSLINITVEMTYRCQWACDFCFLKDNVLNRRVDELSLDELKALVDQAAPHGISFFVTGGEPFVRKDTLTFLQYIKSKKLKAGVNTNHTLLDEAAIDTLRAAKLDYLITSIHGPREVHDAVTGRKCFDDVIERLHYWNSKPRHTRLFANYVMTPETCVHMEAMVDIAADAGLDAVTFQHESFLTAADRDKHEHLWRQVTGQANEVELSVLDSTPTAHDRARLREHMRKAKARARARGLHAVFKPDLSSAEFERWYSDDFYMSGRCSYLYTDMRVNPRGDLITCQPIPLAVGNIREGDPFAQFNGPEYQAFRKAIQEAGGLFPACARCCKLHRRF